MHGRPIFYHGLGDLPVTPIHVEVDSINLSNLDFIKVVFHWSGEASTSPPIITIVAPSQSYLKSSTGNLHQVV
jgi:hypothetical protein